MSGHKPLKIKIDNTGKQTFVYNDKFRDLIDEGPSQTTRASHVEPGANGDWIADLRPSGGPVQSGFRTRQEALDFELRWLDENVIEGADG